MGTTGTAIAAVLAAVLAGTSAAAAYWPDYEIVMWHDNNAAQLDGLKRLGVTAGRVFGTRDPASPVLSPERIAPLRAAGLRWYVENFATDFYASYHRWQPGRAVNWLFEQVRERYRRDPSDPTAFIREPSLSDPVWQARIAARLQAHARAHAPYRPLFYSLGDETGIADLSAAWDFDRSPVALAAFRFWLRSQYGTLVALNRQWETDFPAWDTVLPATTDAALARPDENFSAWADFKAWMDLAFAGALRAGTDALHTADPGALAAIEGVQLPGWGGYDDAQLARAVDVMEISRAGLPAMHGLNPALVLLTTSFRDGPAERRAIWRDLLRGARGLVLWDEQSAMVAPDGTPGPRGRDLAATFAELRGGLAARLLGATPQVDPVAILYSQDSFRIRWLLDRRAEGSWFGRGAQIELGDNAWRTALRDAERALTGAGLQPAWLDAEAVADGALRDGRFRALVLPQTIALSAAVAAEIRAFAAAGGLVVADARPGMFDGHGRRLERSALAGASIRHMPTFRPAALAAALRGAGVAAGFALEQPDGSIAENLETRVFCDGDITLIGLLPQADDGPDTELVLVLPRPAKVEDLHHPAPVAPPAHAPRRADRGRHSGVAGGLPCRGALTALDYSASASFGVR
jgi:hypothetical protein